MKKTNYPDLHKYDAAIIACLEILEKLRRKRRIYLGQERKALAGDFGL